MGLFDPITNVLLRTLRQPIESYIRLETADDETTFVSKDGSLVTLIALNGATQIVGPSEYNNIVESATLKLGSRFDRPGQALQIYFERNPDKTDEMMRKLIRPTRLTAKIIGLDLDDLLDEREKNLARFVSAERAFFVLWTRPAVLTKANIAEETKERKKNKWVAARESQFPFAAMEALRTRHSSFKSGVISALEELQLRVSPVEVHEAIRAIRESIYPGRDHSQFMACLPGDPIPPRAPTTKMDYSDVLWPSLASQIAIGSAEILKPTIVRVDNLIWAAIDMTLAPMEPAPFPALFSRIQEAKIPFRISYLIESGGIQGSQFRKNVASILAFTSSTNQQIRKSLEVLAAYARNKPVVKLRISLATWAPDDNVGLLQQRISMLIQAVESWGYCQVSQDSGDALSGLMSSALAIHCASTAPAAVAPLHEGLQDPAMAARLQPVRQRRDPAAHVGWQDLAIRDRHAFADPLVRSDFRPARCRQVGPAQRAQPRHMPEIRPVPAALHRHRRYRSVFLRPDCHVA